MKFKQKLSKKTLDIAKNVKFYTVDGRLNI